MYVGEEDVWHISTRNDLEAFVKKRDWVLTVDKEIRTALEAGDTERAMGAMQSIPMNPRSLDISGASIIRGCAFSRD